MLMPRNSLYNFSCEKSVATVFPESTLEWAVHLSFGTTWLCVNEGSRAGGAGPGKAVCLQHSELMKKDRGLLIWPETTRLWLSDGTLNVKYDFKVLKLIMTYKKPACIEKLLETSPSFNIKYVLAIYQVWGFLNTVPNILRSWNL